MNLIMNTSIYIVGNGAIGKALAVFLKLENKNVAIIRGSVDDGSIYTEEITVTLPDVTHLKAEIEIKTVSSLKKLNGLVVLTNKSFGNEAIAKMLKRKVGDSPLVILQNGLGIEKVFVENNFPEVYRCVLFATSQIKDENKLSFKPVSTCPIGIIKGSEATLNWIADQLSTQHFQFRSEPNINKVIWKKAIVNSVFNSICPLLEIDNGIFYRDENALLIAKRIIAECISISTELGVPLAANEVMESLMQISKSSEGQLISTLQDIKNHRMTEIDTLNLEIVRIAANLGKENLVRETKLLGELVKIKSELSLNAGAKHRIV
jgi:2-dehydropantoate 2-reductase